MEDDDGGRAIKTDISEFAFRLPEQTLKMQINKKLTFTALIKAVLCDSSVS